MRISTLFYTLKQGFINIKKNKLYSLASVGTMTACIFIIGLFIAVALNMSHIVKNAEKHVEITILFDEGTTEARIFEIAEMINRRAEVANTEYISAEEAWEKFKKEYFGDKEYLAEGFDGANPLSKSASLVVHLNDLSMQTTFVVYTEDIEGVRQVNYSANTANIFSDFGRLIGVFSAAIILILLGVGIFLISNTVMVGITVRKQEIGIMKLIGATDFFVRAPFLIEGVIIGLVGASIPLAIIYFVYNEVIVYLMSQFNSINGIFDFLPVSDIFKVLLPIALCIGAGIGWLGSYITVRKHLNV